MAKPPKFTMHFTMDKSPGLLQAMKDASYAEETVSKLEAAAQQANAAGAMMKKFQEGAEAIMQKTDPPAAVVHIPGEDKIPTTYVTNTSVLAGWYVEPDTGKLHNPQWFNLSKSDEYPNTPSWANSWFVAIKHTCQVEGLKFLPIVHLYPWTDEQYIPATLTNYFARNHFSGTRSGAIRSVLPWSTHSIEHYVPVSPTVALTYVPDDTSALDHFSAPAKSALEFWYREVFDEFEYASEEKDTWLYMQNHEPKKWYTPMLQTGGFKKGEKPVYTPVDKSWGEWGPQPSMPKPKAQQVPSNVPTPENQIENPSPVTKTTKPLVEIPKGSTFASNSAARLGAYVNPDGTLSKKLQDPIWNPAYGKPLHEVIENIEYQCKKEGVQFLPYNGMVVSVENKGVTPTTHIPFYVRYTGGGIAHWDNLPYMGKMSWHYCAAAGLTMQHKFSDVTMANFWVGWLNYVNSLYDPATVKPDWAYMGTHTLAASPALPENAQKPPYQPGGIVSSKAVKFNSVMGKDLFHSFAKQMDPVSYVFPVAIRVFNSGNYEYHAVEKVSLHPNDSYAYLKKEAHLAVEKLVSNYSKIEHLKIIPITHLEASDPHQAVLFPVTPTPYFTGVLSKQYEIATNYGLGWTSLPPHLAWSEDEVVPLLKHNKSLRTYVQFFRAALMEKYADPAYENVFYKEPHYAQNPQPYQKSYSSWNTPEYLMQKDSKSQFLGNWVSSTSNSFKVNVAPVAVSKLRDVVRIHEMHFPISEILLMEIETLGLPKTISVLRAHNLLDKKNVTPDLKRLLALGVVFEEPLRIEKIL